MNPRKTRSLGRTPVSFGEDFLERKGNNHMTNNKTTATNRKKAKTKTSTKNRSVSVKGAALILAALLPAAFALRATAQQPDNTKTNQAGGTTADQQKNGMSDIEITRKIRHAIVEDKSLSTYAHNIKIITKDGSVTLKGPVKSEDEKSAIEAKAATVAGAANVTDEIQVVPAK
jgi:hyperosmotically inducible periplasmic protein